MGNSLFAKGTVAAEGLTAGLWRGMITGLKEGSGEYGDYVIFNGYIDHDGSRENVSDLASYDTKLTRKMMRYLLAINGMTKDQWPVDGDISTLNTSGEVMIEITFEQNQRQLDGKFKMVPTEFPQIANILPLPREEKKPVRTVLGLGFEEKSNEAPF